SREATSKIPSNTTVSSSRPTASGVCGARGSSPPPAATTPPSCRRASTSSPKPASSSTASPPRPPTRCDAASPRPCARTTPSGSLSSTTSAATPGPSAPSKPFASSNATRPLEQVKTAVLEYGHSRVPVFRENLDDIVGILYAKDLIELLHTPGTESDKAAEFDLESILRDSFLVPESKKVLELLHEFRATKVHMAVVLDEYGGTAGLITIEDILEEIVGEIQDEYEPEDETPEVIAIDETSAKVDARMHLDDLNDQLDLDLPEDEDYDTVGGFVFAELGHIPEAGETFEAHGIKVTVDEAERTKVIAVTVEKLDAVPESAS
ncbi:MAG: transporter associated domain-containing protein, partial [Planctomycetota bacterium]